MVAAQSNFTVVSVIADRIFGLGRENQSFSFGLLGGKGSANMPKKQSLKNQIRAIRRMLGRNKDSMSEEARAHQEKRLRSLEQKQMDNKQREKERKLAKRYHHVKFFEKKKVLKKIKQLERRLKSASSSTSSSPISDVQHELQRARDNLIYIQYFPKNAKYVSLFAKSDEKTDNTAKIAALLKRAKERKQQEARAEALRIENIDKRDYDDDDGAGSEIEPESAKLRKGKEGNTDGGTKVKSLAAEMGVVDDNIEQGESGKLQDDFFM